MPDSAATKKILIQANGPYRVEGGVPLFIYSQEMSADGEPLNWLVNEEISPAKQPYLLCRCGKSASFPFCDGSHQSTNFDGTETYPTDKPYRPTLTLQASSGLTIKKYQGLCMSSGFCILKSGGIEDFSEFSDDPEDHKIAIKMVEDCPAGALTYSLDPESPDIEPELPMQIALTREGCNDEMINGPFWVMGGLPIERADKLPFLPRNRVTLCACGQSKHKPLCDGTHRVQAEAEFARRKKAS